MRNKRGIELAINMIVILVLAAAMLAMGLQLSMRFFDKAEDMRLNIDRQTDDRIRTLLDDGALVANPLNRLEVRGGDGDVFALGINNQLSDTGGPSDDFHITVTRGDRYPNAGTCPNDKVTLTTIDGQYTLGNPPTIDKTIQKNQKANTLIGVSVERGTPHCTYVFNVHVTYGAGTRYGNSVYKLYLKVM